MSFSISGSGKTKAEAVKSVTDSFIGSQPYAPADALNACLASVQRLGEPGDGKILSLYAGGHASQGAGDLNDGYTLTCYIADAPKAA